MQIYVTDNIFHLWSTLIRVTFICRRIPPTLIRVTGFVIAYEYCRRLFDLLDSYSPTNTADAYSNCWTRNRLRIPPTLIRFVLLLFADEYCRRLFELLDIYSPTNTAEAFPSCWTLIRRRIPPTLIRFALLFFADEYCRRLFELPDVYSPNTAEAFSICWTIIRRRIPPTLIQISGLVVVVAVVCYIEGHKPIVQHMCIAINCAWFEFKVIYTHFFSYNFFFQFSNFTVLRSGYIEKRILVF